MSKICKISFSVQFTFEYSFSVLIFQHNFLKPWTAQSIFSFLIRIIFTIWSQNFISELFPFILGLSASICKDRLDCCSICIINLSLNELAFQVAISFIIQEMLSKMFDNIFHLLISIFSLVLHFPDDFIFPFPLKVKKNMKYYFCFPIYLPTSYSDI